MIDYKVYSPFRRRCLIPIGCLLMAMTVPIGYAAESSATPTSTPKSRTTPDESLKGTATEMLQRQAEKLADKIDATDDQLGKANEYKRRVDDAKTALATVHPEATARTKDLLDAFERLKSAKPEEDVSSGRPGTAGASFLTAFGQLRSTIVTPITDLVAPVVPNLKYRYTFGAAPHVNTPLEQLVDDAAGTVLDLKQGDPFEKNAPKINALVLALYRPSGFGVSGEPVKRNTIEAQIADAQNEINSTASWVPSVANDYRTAYTKTLTNASQALQKELDRLQATRDSDQQHLTEINKELLTRSQGVGSRQTTLTDKLIYTELLIIGVLAFAVASLKLYPERIALTVIQERTLGDILGMGLLLVTIIFLATGEFIDKQAVVTLLGTIAGYILARRPSTPPAAGSAAQTRPPAPSNLKEVTPAKPGQVAVSCDPVAQAASYRWYTKLESAAGDLVFTQETAQPQAAITGFHAGDKVVIAVSAMDGQESPRSTPITVTVT